MVIIWYGLAPLTGALFKRYKWHKFRTRFDELRLSPILDYCQYSQQEHNDQNPGSNLYRFVGGFESITDGQTLWIRSEDLTVPVSLQNAETYLLPMQKGDGIPEIFDPGDEAPEKIRWERVSALTEGAKVYVGGLLVQHEGQRNFISTKENPLLVIFYDGPDNSLATRTIRAGRRRGEYWNSVTPYSLLIGALCQILMAVLFLSRPAFRMTVIVALIALFVPLYPLIPPGLLFTVIYRRLAWRSRILRAYRDLARLPLRYLAPSQGNGLINIRNSASQTDLPDNCILPNGEKYGYVRCTELPPQAQNIPLLLPEFSRIAGKRSNTWYIFGALHSEEDNASQMPIQPQDSFATFGILPGRPESIARRCEIAAYLLELLAWIILLAGIGLNIFFLRMVLVLL